MVITATFDFGRGREGKKHPPPLQNRVVSNGLSRLHSFDVFLEDGNTSENDVLLTLRQQDDTTQVALVAILYTSNDGRLKITGFWWELTMVQSKSKSKLMASCVLEGFDYQWGVDLSFSLHDGTLYSLQLCKWHDGLDMKCVFCAKMIVWAKGSRFNSSETRTGSPKPLLSAVLKNCSVDTTPN